MGRNQKFRQNPFQFHFLFIIYIQILLNCRIGFKCDCVMGSDLSSIIRTLVWQNCQGSGDDVITGVSFDDGIFEAITGKLYKTVVFY